MENITTSIIGLIASVVMLVFSIWYIKVNIEINKARQKRIDDLKVYLDEFKTNTKFQFNKIIDSAKEAEKNLEAVSKGAQYVFLDEKKEEIVKEINKSLNEKGIYTIEVPKDLNEFDLSWDMDIDENKIKFVIKK